MFSPVPALGYRMRHMAVNGLTFSYSRHRDNVTKHAHKDMMIVLGSAGAFEESYTGRIRPVTCMVGTALVRPAGEIHSNRFSAGGARDVAIEIDSSALERLRSWKGVVSSVGSWQDRHIAALTHRIRTELELSDAASPLALEALALELLASICRSASGSVSAEPDPVWLGRVTEFIHEEWRHRTIRLTDLAEIARVHPVHLARIYRSRFGETPAGSIRRLRVQWAADQLIVSMKSLSAIALEAGFADQSHFTRMFAGMFGTTPRQWRRSGGRIGACHAR